MYSSTYGCRLQRCINVATLTVQPRGSTTRTQANTVTNTAQPNASQASCSAQLQAAPSRIQHQLAAGFHYGYPFLRRTYDKPSSSIILYLIHLRPYYCIMLIILQHLPPWSGVYHYNNHQLLCFSVIKYFIHHLHHSNDYFFLYNSSMRICFSCFV